MPALTTHVERIVKTVLLDESISTEELVVLMKKNQISSTHLLTYIDDDSFWPIYPPESSLHIAPQDEKYLIDFKNPGKKQAITDLRVKAREAVHTRFFTGHKFNEWMI